MQLIDSSPMPLVHVDAVGYAGRAQVLQQFRLEALWVAMAHEDRDLMIDYGVSLRQPRDASVGASSGSTP
jgi:hypothetical protein